MTEKIYSTTVLCVRKGKTVAMGADGQVTLGQTIIGKASARKVHKLRDGNILAGIAGSTSDAHYLLDQFEKSLEAHAGNLKRAAIEFAKQWRSDKIMRHFQAQLAVADSKDMFLLSGSGDVIIPENNVLAIGSGMGFATAAARALLENTKTDAKKIVEQALSITADICIYTNHNFTIETIND